METRDADSKPNANRCAPRAVVCWEAGITYPSMRAAAAAVGLKYGDNIRFAIEHKSVAGGFHWCYADQPKPAAEQLKQARKRPVICYESGEEFESVTVAAKAIGKLTSTISAALRSGGTAGGFHWYYADGPKPNPSTFKGNDPVVCWDTGLSFSNAKEAADWAGTSEGKINLALNSKVPAGGYHWYRADKPKPKPEELKHYKAVMCLETGAVFPTAKAAAEFAGLKDASCIRRAIGVCKDGRRKTAGGYHWNWVD